MAADTLAGMPWSLLDPESESPKYPLRHHGSAADTCNASSKQQQQQELQLFGASRIRNATTCCGKNPMPDFGQNSVAGEKFCCKISPSWTSCISLSICRAVKVVLLRHGPRTFIIAGQSISNSARSGGKSPS